AELRPGLAYGHEVHDVARREGDEDRARPRGRRLFMRPRPVDVGSKAACRGVIERPRIAAALQVRLRYRDRWCEIARGLRVLLRWRHTPRAGVRAGPILEQLGVTGRARV